MTKVRAAKAKPFVKWVGGKGKLIPQLIHLLPERFNSYYEPFLGGGAFYFAIPTSPKSYLNDINTHLMAAYIHIRDDIEDVVASLKEIEVKYHSITDDEKRKAFYLHLRKEYNTIDDSNFKKAVLLIFLNRTCFNGMYRENKSGKFNVPFGKHKKPTICNEANLRALSVKLQDAELTSKSYEDVVKTAQKGDFIYFDPPYMPLNPTSSFTSYHADDFGLKDQKKLKDSFVELDKRGCYVMLSNSNSDFIKDIYSDYRIEKVYAARSINSVGSGRGKIAELVILNY